MSKHKRKQEDNESNRDAWSMPGPAVPRLEKGQSGFDPLGARQEAAFAQGLFIRNLFTLRLRTHKRWALGLMLLLGTCLVLPLALSALEWVNGAKLSAPLLLVIPIAVIGLFFFVNVVLSINSRGSHRNHS
ncbi:MAG: hypothetical protein EYC68_20425 [Chloroflexota bacterium]|nr:MAG: hypothetical protein EYC68_20425 [Chloroflexota bacterium]